MDEAARCPQSNRENGGFNASGSQASDFARGFHVGGGDATSDLQSARWTSNILLVISIYCSHRSLRSKVWVFAHIIGHAFRTRFLGEAIVVTELISRLWNKWLYEAVNAECKTINPCVIMCVDCGHMFHTNCFREIVIPTKNWTVCADKKKK